MGHIVDDTKETKAAEEEGAPPTNFKLYYSSVGEEDQLVFNQLHFYYNLTTKDYDIFEQTNLFYTKGFGEDNKVDFTAKGTNLVYNDVDTK